MADNNLRVRIVASDEATAVLEKFKKRLDGVETPTKRLAKATKDVTKSTRGWRQMGQSGSFDQISKGIRSIGSEAHTAFRGVGRLSASLGSLAELGGAASIGAAAIGAMALTKHWADVGVATSNAAANIGITTGELYRYQRAAALTGVSSDSVTSNLTGLQTAMFQATNGLNPAASNMLKLLGVHAQDAHGKMLPLSQLLPKLADSIDKLSPQGQMAAVSGLGMSSDMLPFLRQGGAKIKAEMNQLSQQGVGDNFGGSQQLYQDWAKLDTAASNTADIFAQRLEPAADSVVKALTAIVSWLPHATTPSPPPAPYSDFYGHNVREGNRLVWVPSGYTPGPSSYSTQSGYRKLWHASPKGIVENNPLNLHYANQDGTVGQDGKFAVFKNLQLGVTAAANQILHDVKPVSQGGHGLSTLSSLIGDPTYGWAPAAGGNDPAAYTNAVSDRTNIKPNVPLNLDAPTLKALLNAQAIQETGQPIPSSILDHAVNAALGIPYAPSAPSGVPVSAPPSAHQPKPSAPPRELSAHVDSVLSGLRAHQAPNGTVTIDVNHNNVPQGVTSSAATSGPGVALGGVKINKAMTGSST